jgi:hypothetical protein
MSEIQVPAQLVDATQALNLSDAPASVAIASRKYLDINP